MARVVSQDILDLPLTTFIIKRDKNVRPSEVTIIFGDLVFEDKMVAEGVPGQLGNEAMILVEVVTIVSEDDIRRLLCLKCLKVLLELRAKIRQKAIAEFLWW